MKTIPDADPELVRQAGLHADRVSINIEQPTVRGLNDLAPEKSVSRIEGAMGETAAGGLLEVQNLSRLSVRIVFWGRNQAINISVKFPHTRFLLARSCKHRG